MTYWTSEHRKEAQMEWEGQWVELRGLNHTSWTPPSNWEAVQVFPGEARTLSRFLPHLTLQRMVCCMADN